MCWCDSRKRTPWCDDCRPLAPAAPVYVGPRRNDLYRLTHAEQAIRAAIRAVEDMPADPRLTNAVVALLRAQSQVADVVDGIL